MNGPPALIPKVTGGRPVVGVDPGVQGAIGIIGPDTAFIDVYDLPTIGEGRAGEFDADLLWSIIRDIAEAHACPHVRLEWPQTRPTEAPESSKRFGVGLGLLWGLFRAAGCPVERVAPNKWKGRLGLVGKKQAGGAGVAKQQAVDYAELVIPGLPADAVRGPRGGMLDGRAEALLIAWEAVSRTELGLRSMSPHLREMRVLMGGKKKRSGFRGPVL